MRTLICFTAMFKNEAATVRKTLESVRDVIDTYCVVDTGSTDDTKAIVREVFSRTPGAIYDEPFVDFAATRNRCLELAGEDSVFTLTLSADEVLADGVALRAYLEEQRDAADGAYLVTMRNPGKIWPSARVLRTDAKWRYVGDVHEIPEGPNFLRTGPLAPGTVTHDESDPARKYARMRDYDLPRLEKRLTDNAGKPPEELATAIWWLAQTHDALAEAHPPHVSGGPWLRHKLEAMALYWRRSQIGDDLDQSAYAYFASLQVAERLGFIYAPDELLGRLQVITEMSPGLAEAYYLSASISARLDVRQGLALAERAAEVAREAVAKQATGAFALRGANLNLEWACLGLAANCAAQLERKEKARALATRALTVGGPREKFAQFLEDA